MPDSAGYTYALGLIDGGVRRKKGAGGRTEKDKLGGARAISSHPSSTSASAGPPLGHRALSCGVNMQGSQTHSVLGELGERQLR